MGTENTENVPVEGKDPVTANQGTEVVAKEDEKVTGVVAEGGGADDAGAEVEESAQQKYDAIPKEDWFKTRLGAQGTDAKTLMSVYGKDGFDALDSKENYWKDAEIKKKFVDEFGVEAKSRFDDFYDNMQFEYSSAKLDRFTGTQSAMEEYAENVYNYKNKTETAYLGTGLLQHGDVWGGNEKDQRQIYDRIHVKRKNDDGTEVDYYVDYSPEELKKLEEDGDFDGLTYDEGAAHLGRYAEISGLAYGSVYKGRTYNDFLGEYGDVKNGQVVSRWDIETGNWTDGLLANNKMEADGAWDYLKIAIKSPINLVDTLLDTAIQMGRLSLAGSYGMANWFIPEKHELNIRNNEFYQTLTSMGIKVKGYQTSMSNEAMTDGFFGSAEAFLSTIFDVAAQVGAARALNAAGQGVVGLFSEGMTAKQILNARKLTSMVMVRGTLTAMAAKDSYNEALEIGFTESEASVIGGAMTFALWKATKMAEYIYGGYDDKVARKQIESSFSMYIRKLWQKHGMEPVTDIAEEAVKKETKKNFAKSALTYAESTVKSVFNTQKANLGGGTLNRAIHEARNEAFEEMTEEFYQDIVKHGATIYGYGRYRGEVGDRRYMTIYDKGFMKDAAHRYMTSFVAGGFGGPMGMVGNGRVTKMSLTSTSSIAEIVAADKVSTLLEVMAEARDAGRIGPLDLSTKYNEKIQAFEVMMKGEKGQVSLGQMVHDQIVHDINATNTILHSGHFDEALKRFSSDDDFKATIENVSMTTDFVKIAAATIDLHDKTGMSLKIYDELNDMTASELNEKIRPIAKSANEKIENLKKKRTDLKDEIEAWKVANGEKKPSKPSVANEDDEDKSDESLEGKTKELSRLDKEIEVLGEDVSTEDVTNLLENFRKLKAMGNGSASEFYLIQKWSHDNPIYGSVKNRKPGFERLGKTPIVDKLHAVREATLVREKDQLYKEKKAKEIEEKIDSISTLTPETTAELNSLIERSGDLMSKETLTKIIELVNGIDYSAVNSMFDPTSAEYAFAKMDEGSKISLLKAMLSASGTSGRILVQHITQDSHLADGFGKVGTDLDEMFSQMLMHGGFDQSGAVFKTTDEFEGGVTKWLTSKSLSFLNQAKAAIESGAVGSAELNTAIETGLSQGTMELIEKARDAEARIENKNVFDPKNFDPKDLSVFFGMEQMGNNGLSSSKMNIADKALAHIDRFLEHALVVKDENGQEEVRFTLKDHSGIDEVLFQIEEREAFASMMIDFMPGSEVQFMSNKPKMLAQFRKNTINIIEGEYSPTRHANTVMDEEHAFKDYTQFSDMFTDYFYDPIAYDNIVHKDQSTWTKEDQDFLSAAMAKRSVLDTALLDKNGEISGFNDKVVQVVSDAMRVQFNEYATAADITAAVRMLSGLTIDVGEGFEVELTGITRLKLMKPILNSVKGIIKQSKDASTPTAFIEEKQIHIRRGFERLDRYINKLDLPQTILDKLAEEVPDYIDVTASDTKTNEEFIVMAKVSMQLENFLFSLYNGRVNLDDTGVKQENLEKIMLDTLTEGADRQLDFDILAAITTDLTPFYAKLKTVVEELNPASDDVFMAAQEYAAKAVAVATYSSKYNDTIREILKKEDTAAISEGLFIGTFIEGSGGSGKSTITTKIGLKIGAAILADDGMASKVIAVGNHKKQVDIISKGVGENIAKVGGMLPGDVEVLLEKAVKGDAKAKEGLEDVGVILMDEMTYVEFDSANKESQLARISDLIIAYNSKYRAENDIISLIGLGDTSQSGSPIKNSVGDIVDTKSFMSVGGHARVVVDKMTYSFRGRNSYMTKSISAIEAHMVERRRSFDGDIEDIENGGFTSTVSKTDGKTLIHGKTNNKWHGIKYETTAETSIDKFVNAIDGFTADIIKSIDDAKAAGKPFTVLISPENVDDFKNSNSEILKYMKDDEYKDHITIIPADKIGGSEANYVFAEIPSNTYTAIQKSNSKIRNIVSKMIYTAASRPFDFVYIVDKSDMGIIPFKAIGEQVDGEVILPDTALDSGAKTAVRETYLKILEDVDPTAVTETIEEVQAREEGEEEVNIDSILEEDEDTEEEETINETEEEVLVVEEDMKAFVAETAEYLKSDDFSSILGSIISGKVSDEDIISTSKILASLADNLIGEDADMDMSMMKLEADKIKDRFLQEMVLTLIGTLSDPKAVATMDTFALTGILTLMYAEVAAASDNNARLGSLTHKGLNPEDMAKEVANFLTSSGSNKILKRYLELDGSSDTVSVQEALKDLADALAPEGSAMHNLIMEKFDDSDADMQFMLTVMEGIFYSANSVFENGEMDGSFMPISAFSGGRKFMTQEETDEDTKIDEDIDSWLDNPLEDSGVFDEDVDDAETKKKKEEDAKRKKEKQRIKDEKKKAEDQKREDLAEAKRKQKELDDAEAKRIKDEEDKAKEDLKVFDESIPEAGEMLAIAYSISLTSLRRYQKNKSMPKAFIEIIKPLKKVYTKESIKATVASIINRAADNKKSLSEFEKTEEGLRNLIALSGLPLDLSKGIEKITLALNKYSQSENVEEVWFASEARKLISSIYRKQIDTSTNVGTKLFYDRGVENYDMQEYINNADDKRKTVHTVEVTGESRQMLAKRFPDHKVLTTEERLAFLGMGQGGMSSDFSDYGKVSIMAVISNHSNLEMATNKTDDNGNVITERHEDFFIVVESASGEKVILSQLDSEAPKAAKPNANGRFTVEYSQKTTKVVAQFLGEHDKNGVRIFSMDQKAKDFLTVRAGSTIDGVSSIAEFKASSTNVAVSDKVYTVIDPESGMAGESFLIYSPNVLADLENKEKDLSNAAAGNTFATESDENAATSNIGILPLRFDIPFSELVKVGKKFTYQNNPSIASMFFLKFFGDHILKKKEGNYIGGKGRNIPITKQAIESGEGLISSYNAQVESIGEENLAILDDMFNSLTPRETELMEAMADAHLYNVLDRGLSTFTDVSGEVEESTTTDLWSYDNVLKIESRKGILYNVLDINLLIDSFQNSIMGKYIGDMEGILNKASYKVKPTLRTRGATDTSSGVAALADPDLLTTFADFITVPSSGIAGQEIELSSNFTAALASSKATQTSVQQVADNNISATKALAEFQKSFTLAQLNGYMNIMSIAASNLDPNSIEAAELMSAIQVIEGRVAKIKAIDSLLKGLPDAKTKEVLLADMKAPMFANVIAEADMMYNFSDEATQKASIEEVRVNVSSFLTSIDNLDISESQKIFMLNKVALLSAEQIGTVTKKKDALTDPAAKDVIINDLIPPELDPLTKSQLTDEFNSCR